MIVKICRVKNLHAARFCADVGADMLGLHVIDGVSDTGLRMLVRIGREIALYYPEVAVVLVTKLRDATLIGEVMRRVHARVVQLHFPIGTSKWTALCRGIERTTSGSIQALRVFAASDVGRRASLHRAKLERRFTSYFLIDSSWRGGSGIRSGLRSLSEIVEVLGHKKTIIAGGLTPHNVLPIIRKVRPGGVDIQSGLEKLDKERDKDPILVRSFIDTVKGVNHHTSFECPPRPLVSFAVAGVDDRQANADLKRLRLLDVDTLHLDHSDGSMAPHFLSKPVSVAHALRNVAPCLPFDLHLLVREAGHCAETIDLYLSKNPLLRLAIIHIASINDAKASRVGAVANYARNVGIGFAVALHAPRLTPHTIRLCLGAIQPFVVKGISLITHSERHSVEHIVRYDVPLFGELLKWARATSFRGHLGLDRNMTPQKLELFREMQPNAVVVGAALRFARRPQALVTRLRKSLSCPAVL